MKFAANKESMQEMLTIWRRVRLMPVERFENETEICVYQGHLGCQFLEVNFAWFDLSIVLLCKLSSTHFHKLHGPVIN